MEGHAPSPPESSTLDSDYYEEESVGLSPPASPSISSVDNASRAASPWDGDAPSPPLSVLPPGPGSAGNRTPSDLDEDFPSASPGSSPMSNPVGTLPNVPESIPSSSPTIAFPWAKIPLSLQQHFEIPYRGTVTDLASISFTPGPLCLKPCCQPRLVKAKDFLDGEAAVDVIRTMPTPGLPGIVRTVNAWTPRKQFNAVELRHGNAVHRFSPWALTVWHRFVTIRESISQWQRATEQARESNDHDTMKLLQSFRWNGDSGIRDASLPSIARLGTSQWLNDEAVSMLIYMVDTDLKGTRAHMLTSYGSNFIRASWHQFQRAGTWPARQWISNIYEDFKSGALECLGLCVHVLAGAGPHAQGNHWIGIVINARKSTILIGDSLNMDPHPDVIKMLKWFLAPAVQGSFSTLRLQSSPQPGTWSCGDYAVNMVAHYLLPDAYPLVGSLADDAIEHRRQLFRRALKVVKELVSNPVTVEGCIK